MWPLVGQACWIVRTIERVIVQSRQADSSDAVLIVHPLTRELLARLLALVRAFATHITARPAVGSDVARAVLDDILRGSGPTTRIDALLSVLRMAAEAAILADAGAC